MQFVSHYQCTICHTIYGKNEQIMTCPTCGEKGILDIVYDYESIKEVMNRDYFYHHDAKTMWRYLPLMSVKPTKLSNTLQVGWTPLYRSNQLENMLGVKALYIKDEGQNPTQSLKDRASAVAVIKAIESGAETVCCSSTGNAASSLAGNAARMGLKTVIFVPERAPLGKLSQLLAFGANLIQVKGDYKETFNLSKYAIEEFGYYNRNAAINPHLVEGKKTVAFEIAEQLDFQPTDWVVTSVGDGCTVGAVYKGFYDLFHIGLISKIPKILGVQSEECAPFVKAFETNSPIQEAEENTIADSISVGIPRNPIKAMRAISESSGAWIAVPDGDIIRAIETLGSNEGIFAEPAAAASYAGLEYALNKGIIKLDETVTVIVTGNGLKDTANALKITNKPKQLEPDKDKLFTYLKQLEEVKQ